MTIKVINMTNYVIELSMPIERKLPPRETRTYNWVIYDDVINTPSIVNLLVKDKIRIENLDAGGATLVSQWDQEPKLRTGGYVYWVDATGALRIKLGDPTSDLDGFVVGPGGAPVAHGPTHVFDGVDPVPDIEVLEEPWTCTATEVVLNAVYAASSNTVNQADNAATSTMPVVGIVKTKPTPTTCTVARSGELAGFVGLTPGAHYYAGTAGALTTTPPTASGSVAQRVGYAKNATTLVVERGVPIRRA